MQDDQTPKLTPAGQERRSFTRKTSILAGGIALASATSGLAHAAGQERIRLAVVGCGGRGVGAMAQAMKADLGVELVAVADAFPDQAQRCAMIASKMFPEWRIKVTPETTFSGFDAYRQAIDLADVVILTTPPGFRPEHFAYAVAQGKHCFVEKPVATDVPGIRTVLEASRQAQEKKLNVVVGLQRRYQPCYLEVEKRLRDGAVGEIISGQVYWNSPGVWVRKREPGQTELEYQMRNWYYFNWLCGDHIVEQHMHNIDVANWYIGEYPVSAQGMGGRQVRRGADHGQIFDHHFVEFTYPSGAVIASQCRHQPGCHNLVEERFQCTGGRIRTSDSNTGEVTARNGNEIYRHGGLLDSSPYQTEHNLLFAAIRSGQVINDGEHGARSTLTAIMGRMATYSGEVIRWDEAIDSRRQLVPASSTLDWAGTAPVMPDGAGNYPVPIPGRTKVL